MANLELQMDSIEFERYTRDGYFTIRRSDKAFSGIRSDMTIEQTLNRFFGTDLKHGRGVTPSVVARYLLTMPSVFNLMENLENYCGIKSHTSEQHVDNSESRMKRDNNDINEFIYWLQNHSPFKPSNSSVSLSTGIIGGPNIDCHKAIEKGLLGMNLMVGKNAGNISLSKTYTVKNLSAAVYENHLQHENTYSIDTNLLFQRIAIIFQDDPDKMREAFAYELAPFPLSFFNEKGVMRKTPKSKLYSLFKTCNQTDFFLLSKKFVIDGGWLLHAVVWPHSQTYENIFYLYLSYITKNFDKSAIVVFDGYCNESIGVKSYERYLRNEKNIGVDVDISKEKMVTIHQTKFLPNVSNKFKFVDLLTKYLQEHGITTKTADEDADVLIVDTAIQLNCEVNESIVVIGNDVDLLILLVAKCPDEKSIYFYKISADKKKICYIQHQTMQVLEITFYLHTRLEAVTRLMQLLIKGKKKHCHYYKKTLIYKN